jgi:catechol 2,3-dioxygenase-like lactoylglutathione lyase family enzyme
MLSNYPLYPTLPAADLDRARRFYEQTLGFTPANEDPEGILYESGGSRFLLYPSQFAGTGQQTVASWEVDDLEKVVTDLRQRGIVFEQYDLPGLKTDQNGIAELGDTRGVWFKDTEGNILSVSERPA